VVEIGGPAGPVDETSLAHGVRVLAAVDPDLAAVVERHGPPPLWRREPGFDTLVRIVLEQQVSLASGRAAYDRLARAVGSVSPTSLAETDQGTLEAAGLTRQKARYLRELGSAAATGVLDIDGLAALDDATVRSALCAIPGIGPWTADVYLLMALRRPDVWPAADVALATAARRVKRLAERPDPVALERLAEPWRPWRAVAARLLWHAYLEERGRPAE
jgi:DNA-3-methyladenine glycosylase II